MTNLEIFEALSYISGVFPNKEFTNQILTEGPTGAEEYTLRGDDLAGAIWHLNELMEHFGVPRDPMEAARAYWNLLKKEREA